MKCLISGVRRHAIGDYPGLSSITVIFGKCGLKCKICKPEKSEEFELEELIKTLNLDGIGAVFISGCEPLAHYSACEFMADWAKKNKLKVGIRTYGLFEKELRKMTEKKIVDFVRLEICAPLDYAHYKKVMNVTKEMFNSIKSSIGLLRASGLNYEYYTRISKEINIKEAEIIYKQVLPCMLYVVDVRDFRKNDISELLKFADGKGNLLLRM